MRSWLGTVAAVAAVSGCTAPATPVLPDPDTDLGLGEVVLLAWTTRSPEGLLGHAMEPGTTRVDPHRKAVSGEPHWVETSQKMRIVVSHRVKAEVAAGQGPVGASAGVGRATHVAYDVHLTRYLELPPESLRYAAASGCCLEGHPTDACGERYVVRLMWGSGSVEYLQQIDANAEVSAAEIVHARGGTAYRRLNEMSFEDAFFAYEAAPLEGLCAKVAPEDEVAPLAVAAPPNCRVHAYREDGTREAKAWRVPDEALCRKIADRTCRDLRDVVACQVTFGAGDSVRTFTVPESAPDAGAPADATAPEDVD
jgi:hypothetical protein